VPSPGEPLAALGPSGRRYVGRRRVRLGDVTPRGTLRLDALARYAQDVSNDDTTDAGLEDDLAWVVRRTVVQTLAPARFGEDLVFVTFCSGMGRAWAERRLHVTGDGGARLEVATLWVHLDPATGRPRPLSEQFVALYGEAAQGRRVGARRTLAAPPEGAERRPWTVRAADLDLFGHVNNAAYWAVVEDLLADHPVAAPWRAVAEYGAGLGRGDRVEVRYSVGAGGLAAWLVGGGAVHASFTLAPV
jgi:acyl-ACP thioesterase